MKDRRSLLPAVLLAGVLALAVGAGSTLTAVLVARELVGHRALPETARVCKTDPSLSGLQGYCVTRHHRRAGLLTDERAEIHITAVLDGGNPGRYFVTASPFHTPDGRFDVRFTDTGVQITGDDEITVFYPEPVYRLT